MSLLFAGAAGAAVDVPGPSVRATSTYFGNYIRNLTVTIPASAQVGDLLVIGIKTIGGNPQTPSGWTLRVSGTSSGTQSGRTEFCQLFVYTKVCASGDPGANITWVISAAQDTMAAGITVALQNASSATPTSTSSYYKSNAIESSWTLPGPATYVGKKPARIEFFAQTPRQVFPSTIPNFSYSGAATLIASRTHDYGRINFYFDDNTTNTASASMSSDRSGECAAVGLAIRGI